MGLIGVSHLHGPLSFHQGHWVTTSMLTRIQDMSCAVEDAGSSSWRQLQFGALQLVQPPILICSPGCFWSMLFQPVTGITLLYACSATSLRDKFHKLHGALDCNEPFKRSNRSEAIFLHHVHTLATLQADMNSSILN